MPHRPGLAIALLLGAAATSACGFDATGTGASANLFGDSTPEVFFDAGNDQEDTSAPPDARLGDAPADTPSDARSDAGDAVDAGDAGDAIDAIDAGDAIDAADAADAADASVDAGPPFCDPTDGTLVACYRFDGDAKDGSSFKNDLTATGVSYVAGVSGQALSLSPTAMVRAPDTASFAVTTMMTIELWVRARTLPAAGRAGLIDDDGRFGIFVYAPGVPRATSPAALDAPSALVAGVWTHLAFTYDGATMILYVNGTAVSTQAIAGAFGAPSGNGVAVGMNSPSGDVLDGELDSLRVFRVARSASEICRAAGTC